MQATHRKVTFTRETSCTAVESCWNPKNDRLAKEGANQDQIQALFGRLEQPQEKSGTIFDRRCISTELALRTTVPVCCTYVRNGQHLLTCSQLWDVRDTKNKIYNIYRIIIFYSRLPDVAWPLRRRINNKKLNNYTDLYNKKILLKKV